jgi:hypothetical protein
MHSICAGSFEHRLFREIGKEIIYVGMEKDILCTLLP